MNTRTKKNLSRYLLITQISIFVFIILHAIAWHIFGIHGLTKLCPFAFADHIGGLELNLNVLFWVLVIGSTFIVGRAFCAWGCMFGAYQDFISRMLIALKIKPGVNKTASTWVLISIDLLLFGGFALSAKQIWPSVPIFASIILIFGVSLWIFMEKKQSLLKLFTLPRYILFAEYLAGIAVLWIKSNPFTKGVSFEFDKYGVLEGEKWVAQLLLAILVALGIGFVEKRIFCKYLCPIGVMLQLTSATPLFNKKKVRATSLKCTECGKCTRVCPMSVDPVDEIKKYKSVQNGNCINCLRCVSECPKNAIDFSSKAKSLIIN